MCVVYMLYWGPIENYLFLWPLPEHVTLEAALNENQKVVTQIKNEVPVYHRRVLRNKLIHSLEVSRQRQI